MLQTPGMEYQTIASQCLTASHIDSLDYIEYEMKPQVCAVLHALEALGNLASIVRGETTYNFIYALIDDQIDLAADVGRLVVAIKS
jgi:hypothetical protein